MKVIDFETRAFQKRSANRLRKYSREIAFPKERLTAEKKKEMQDFALSIAGAADEKVDGTLRSLAHDLLILIEDYS